MKPQRSRSRPKNNRNRTNSNNASGGNVMNRVFDSSGPEGKVRGTPQQIIDKYNQLARDAQLSNDRVATETFQQHAEHYMRMLSEATREMEMRREEQERQNRERQIERDREREERLARQEQQAASQPKPVEQTEVPADPAAAPQPDVMETSVQSGLVETPETQSKPKTRQRRKPRPKPVEQTADQAPAAEATVPRSETPDAAE
ncbi:DUF4167 domain-containing protein [Ascidiaceihabitans sp.]|jgi:hypothetical protein|nr:DUF4167 domain-containing protein [Ascidiaceihabitans sp.]